MPKAQASFDEDEKTTIESGWEDEASTTVEQGEVADRLRSLDALKTPLHPGANGAPRNNTNITSTNGGALDEPTVDDQRANAALSLITPTVAPARIVVVTGNDKGQELEIRPGKTYTIGRAIDNDFVLTDIAVSRKHFDLVHENGTWIIVDRKSGNGTVVNGNIEDAPFQLMNGDTIEIGNTQFRFDHANQPNRARPSYTMDLDEEEPSTVAGKPLRDEASIPPQPPMPVPRAATPRPKTVPPPAPLPRPRPPSVAPMPGYNGARANGSMPASNAPLQLGGPLGVPMASPTAPTVQPMQGMQALRPQQMMPPAILGENGVVRPQMLHAHEMQPMQGVMPTTIPGQGPPVAPSQPQLPYGYPNVNDMQPQLAQLQINGMPRDATSTALVQPSPYGQPMHAGAYSLAQPQPRDQRKLKMILAAAALMVFAAIATILIIRSAGGDDKPKPAAKSSEPTVEPIKPTKPEAKPPTAVVDTKPDAKAEEAKKLEDAKKAEEAKKLAEKKAADEAKKAAEAKLAADKAEAARTAEARRAADKEAAARKAELKKEEDARKAAAREEAARIAAEKKAERNKKREADREKRTTVAASTPTTPKPARTADTSDVKAKAESLYRGKKFNEAGAVLRSAASSLGEADARELRSTAAVYEQVGKAYNVGMGPATPAVDAYLSLQKALNLDASIGVYTEELKGKLGQVAPKAALKFMADKNYEAAFKAVRVAENNGGGNSTTQTIRTGLVDAANELYAQAMSEKDTNRDAARTKLQRIRGMVDGKAPVLAKAEKALRDLPK